MRRTSQLRIYCISNTNLLLYTSPSTFTYSSPYHLLHHRFRKKFLLYSLLNKFTNTKKLKTIKTDNKEMRRLYPLLPISMTRLLKPVIKQTFLKPNHLANHAKDNYVLLKNAWDCIQSAKSTNITFRKNLISLNYIYLYQININLSSHIFTHIK